MTLYALFGVFVWVASLLAIAAFLNGDSSALPAAIFGTMMATMLTVGFVMSIRIKL